MRLNAFVDSNVFIFSFEYPDSNSRKIIEYLNKGKIEVVICEKVIREVVRYFEVHHTPDLARLFRRYLLESCIVIPRDEVSSKMDELRGKIKEKDLEQLSVVKKYGLKYLISYDRDFKDFDEYVTPREFVEILGLKPYEMEY